MLKSIIIVFLHIGFIGYFIYDDWGNYIKISLSIIPILSSLFFYIKSNIYTVAVIFHNIREFFFPRKFNWKIRVNMVWNDSVSKINRSALEDFLKNKISNEFDIKYPSQSDSFVINNFDRGTEVITQYNPSSVYFEVSYPVWDIKTFKINLDTHLGKLFNFIQEEFKPEETIYTVSGTCDKYFTDPDLWKLLSESHTSKIEIDYSHNMLSEKGLIVIKKNKNNSHITETVEIPTAFSISKLSQMIADYMHLQLTK